MVPDVGEVKKGVIARYENFLGTSNYKALAQSTQSFNRKLNEERKMRIPYVDGQTGVAMKHYNNVRVSRERMPGRRDDQVYSYPQRRWHKKRYQYLQYFMLPKHLRFLPPGAGPEGGAPTSVRLEESMELFVSLYIFYSGRPCSDQRRQQQQFSHKSNGVGGLLHERGGLCHAGWDGGRV